MQSDIDDAMGRSPSRNVGKYVVAHHSRGRERYMQLQGGGGGGAEVGRTETMAKVIRGVTHKPSFV